jgi:glyoxylase-like metal-dependent hydrolase (beta-lactamase superfamily II)
MMRKLLTGIYIESGYDGVTVGAIELDKGFLLIDAPLKAEDGNAWLAALDEINSDIPKLLVNMDSNPDRTLGAKALDCKIISHTDTMQVFKQRSAIFKAQSIEGGFEWELLGGLSGVRWKPPEQFLSGSVEFFWGGKRIFLNHHPGPESGALWVEVPDQKVVFVGDTVVIKQPPFLEKANIEDWVNSLDILLNDYQDYKIICSRGGLVEEEDIKQLKKFLINVNKQVEKIGKKQAVPTATQKLVDKLLSQWKYPAKYKEFYTDRLRHGLAAYYTRNIYAQTVILEE